MATRTLGLWLCLPVLLATDPRACAGLSEAPAVPRYVYSPNSVYVLDVDTGGAESRVYAAADRTRPLWSFSGLRGSNWAHILLSDDGGVVALIWGGPRAWDGTIDGDAEAVRLVNRDGVLASYRLADITTPPKKEGGGYTAMCGPPGPPWMNGVTNLGNRFVIQTTDGRDHTFRFADETIRVRYVGWRSLSAVAAGLALAAYLLYLVLHRPRGAGV
jgi:hypothetical protein